MAELETNKPSQTGKSIMDNVLSTQVNSAISSGKLLEFIRDNMSDNKTLSIRAMAAMCGVTDKALFEGAYLKAKILAERLTEQGFEGAYLARNGFSARAAYTCIEYYAIDSKVRSDIARKFLGVFATYGIERIFDQLSSPTAQPTQQPPSTTLPNDPFKSFYDLHGIPYP